MPNQKAEGKFLSPHRSKKSTPRKCLKCNDDFLSTGAGNRLCPGCNNKNRDVKQPQTEEKFRGVRYPQ